MLDLPPASTGGADQQLVIEARIDPAQYEVRF